MLTAGDLARDAVVHRHPHAPGKPRVGVVLPTWRRAADGSLQRAVESVLGQEFADLELIVVDDGSTDGTRELLRTWQTADPRLVIVRHELRSGLPAVRVNEGIELSRAPLLAFQFDDDVWLPGALDSLVGAVPAGDEPVVVHGAAELHFPNGECQVLPDGRVDVLTL